MNIQSTITDKILGFATHTYTGLQEKTSRFSAHERTIMGASASFTMIALSSTEALAQTTNGLAGMVTTAATQGSTIKTNLATIFEVFGFFTGIYGMFNLYRKSNPQNHVTAQQVYIPIVAGAFMGAVGWLMMRAGETVGMPTGNQGVIPN